MLIDKRRHKRAMQRRLRRLTERKIAAAMTDASNVVRLPRRVVIKLDERETAVVRVLLRHARPCSHCGRAADINVRDLAEVIDRLSPPLRGFPVYRDGYHPMDTARRKLEHAICTTVERLLRRRLVELKGVGDGLMYALVRLLPVEPNTVVRGVELGPATGPEAA